MGRLIGLDVGAKRTGLATTDEQKLIGSPLRAVETLQVVESLSDLHLESPIEGLVIGVPNLLVGGMTHSSDVIDGVVRKLKKRWPAIPIYLVDESFTSQEASRIQKLGGMKKSKRQEKGSLDAIAASLILQRHLEAPASSRVL